MTSKNPKSHNGPKSKTDKKIDNNIRLALTDICEQSLKDVKGFLWLAHQANYTNFPASLLITCVFETEHEKTEVVEQGIKAHIEKCIQVKLLKTGVKFKAVGRQVVLDSQEACDSNHSGNWAERLAEREGMVVPKNRPAQGLNTH